MTMRCSALDRDSHNQDADLSPWEDPDIHRLADNGCCDTYDSWTRETDVEELARLRQVLVVMPEGGPVGWYSDWWNHGAGGPPAWETFHLRELRQVLEAGHGAGDRRVIAGLSMGGFGALSYAARQPGLFHAVASYSGAVHPLTPGFAEGLLAFIQEEYGSTKLIGDWVCAVAAGRFRITVPRSSERGILPPGRQRS